MAYRKGVENFITECAAGDDSLKSQQALSQEIAFELQQRADEIIRSHPTVILGRNLRLAQGLVALANSVMSVEAETNEAVPQSNGERERVDIDPWSFKTGILGKLDDTSSEISFHTSYSTRELLCSSSSEVVSSSRRSMYDVDLEASSLSSASLEQNSNWNNAFKKYIAAPTQRSTKKLEGVNAKGYQFGIAEKSLPCRLWFRRTFRSMLRRITSLNMRPSGLAATTHRCFSEEIPMQNLKFPFEFQQRNSHSRFSLSRIRTSLANLPDNLRRTKIRLTQFIRRRIRAFNAFKVR